MKPLAAVLFLLPVLSYGAPATAAEYLAYDQGWSWGLGRFSYQWEGPLGRPGAVGRSEASLVHLEYQWPGTRVSVETELINGEGFWTNRGDNTYDWNPMPTLPPVTLWWAEPLPAHPLLQAGPYLATGGNLDLRVPEASTYRVSAGLRARLSAKLAELGDYRPYFTLNLGLDQKGKLVVGGSLEMGTLLAAVLAVMVLGAQNSAKN